MATTNTTTAPAVVATMIRQIGKMNILATSGGRIELVDDETIRLPVHYGYAVEVTYDEGSDTYTVTRTFTRSGVRHEKGQATHVYCDQVGDVVYRAGCFRDPFGS